MTTARSNHPAVSGRDQELRALADAVRRLIDLTVTSVAPAEETAAVAAELGVLAGRLAAHVPDAPVPRYVPQQAPATAPMDRQMPFDVVIGPYSPLAPPVEIEIDGAKAYGRVTFSTAYEGPPGCVHGAVLAGVFDIVLSAANRIAEAAGPTAELTIRYRRPTLLHHPVTFEAEVVETRGRRTRTTGRAVQDGQVTVEAEGTFVALDRADVFRLRDRRR